MNTIKKRILSFIMIVSLVVSMIPATLITAMSEGVDGIIESVQNALAEEIYLNDSKTFTVSSDSETISYVYNNEEAGTYGVLLSWTKDQWADESVDVYSDDEEINSNFSYFGCRSQVYYEANSQHNISIEMNGFDGVEVTVTLVSLSDECEIVDILCNSQYITVGDTVDYSIILDYYAQFGIACDVSVEDSSIVRVADVDYENYLIENYQEQVFPRDCVTFVAENVGQTDVTFSVGGSSVTRTITVLPIYEFPSEGVASTVGNATYLFIPETDGIYSIFTSNLSFPDDIRFDFNISISNSENNPAETKTLDVHEACTDAYIEANLTAGEEYKVVINILGDDPSSISFDLNICVLSYPTRDDIVGIKTWDGGKWTDCSDYTVSTFSGASTKFDFIYNGNNVVRFFNNYSFESNDLEKATAWNDNGSLLINPLSSTEEGCPVTITITVNDEFTVPIYVNVNETPELQLDTPFTVNTKGEYYFTSEESGYYQVRTQNTQTEYIDEFQHALAFVCDMTGYGNNGECVAEAYLEAGKKYRITTSFDEENKSITGTYEIVVTKVDLATDAITIINNETTSCYAGNKNETICVELLFVGDNVLRLCNNVEWSIEDESIVSFDGVPGSTGAMLCLVGSGTTMVKATVNGVKELEVEISVDAGKTLELDVPTLVENSQLFTFTPEESGSYKIYSQNTTSYDGDMGYSHNVDISSSTGEWVNPYPLNNGFEMAYEVYFEAGVEYTIGTFYTYDWMYGKGSFEVCITKLGLPTAIDIVIDDGDKYANTTEDIELNCEGENCAIYTNDLIVTFSDSNIARYDKYVAAGRIFYQATGIVTINVALAANPSINDSVTVRVKALPEIKLDEKVVSSSSRLDYSFTPTVDGVYAVTIKSRNGWFGVSSNGDMLYMYSEWDPRAICNISKFEIRMNSGETYPITITAGDTYSNEYEMSIVKLDLPKSGYIDYFETNAKEYVEPEYVGFSNIYSAYFDGDGISKHSNRIEWETDDPDIVRIIAQNLNDNRVDVSYLSKGTTTLRAKVNGKLILEKEITVSDSPLTLTEQLGATFKSSDGFKVFTFVPSETGKYNFFLNTNQSFGDVDTIVNVFYGSERNALLTCFRSDVECRYTYKLAAGEEYTIAVYQKSGISSTLSAIKGKEPKEIEIVKLPDKLEYYKSNITGEFACDNIIDTRGLELEITWSDGSKSRRRDISGYLNENDCSLWANYVNEDGQNQIELNFGGQTAKYNISLVDSPVTEIRLLEKPTIILGVDSWDGSNGSKCYSINRNVLLVEIHEGDKVYTNEIDRYYPEAVAGAILADAGDGESMDYYELFIGTMDSEEGLTFDESVVKSENPWTIGGDNEMAITYKGFTTFCSMDVAENPYSDMEIISAPTNPRIYNKNCNDLDWFEYYDGRPTTLQAFDGMVLRLFYKDYDADTNPNAYVDKELTGLFAMGSILDGQNIAVYSKSPDDWQIGESSEIEVEYLGFRDSCEVPFEEKDVKNVEVISQPDINIYLDDDRYVGKNGEEGYYLEGYLNLIAGLQFRYEYEDGTFSKTYTVPDLGWTKDAVFEGQYIGYVRQYFGFTQEEALAKDTIYYYFMDQAIPVSINVAKTEPVNGFEFSDNSLENTQVPASSKEEVLNAASNMLDDTQKAAVEAGSVLSTSISVETASEEVSFADIIEIAKLDNQEVAMKLSIDISCKIDDEVLGNITETDKEITIIVEIPEEIRGRDSYLVYREHEYDMGEGETKTEIEVIQPEIIDGKYLKFKSDKFSSYAVSCEASDKKAALLGKIESYNTNNPITIRLYQDGEIKYETSILPDAAIGTYVQDFAIADILAGTYDLEVTKDAHLPFVAKGIEIGENDLDLATSDKYSELNTISLFCGDINGDSIIDMNDIGIIWGNENYLKSIDGEGVEPLADIDGNGIINEFDVNLAWNDRNFGKSIDDSTFSYAS